jgi:hypothetical protein
MYQPTNPTITENNMNIHNFKKLVEIFEDLNDDIKGSHGSVLLEADGSRGGLIDLVVVAADYDATENGVFRCRVITR